MHSCDDAVSGAMGGADDQSHSKNKLIFGGAVEGAHYATVEVYRFASSVNLRRLPKLAKL